MKYYVVCVDDEGTYNMVGELIQCKNCKHSVDYYNDGQCYCRNKNYNGDSLIYISGGWNHHCGYAEGKEENDNLIKWIEEEHKRNSEKAKMRLKKKINSIYGLNGERKE